MKIITAISRIVVGTLFIFSGLIKANDPMGFSYKLEEYFQVFGMDWMVSAALILAIVICIFEVVLGVAVLLGARMKFSATLLLLMIIFFTWLTGYSSVTGKVSDCGCFGDAIPLTPTQSFYKDLILLVLILAIFIKRTSITPLLNEKLANGILVASLILTTSFTLWCFYYLPVIDFRPYKIGNNLIEQMTVPHNAPQDVYETIYTMKNKTTGKTMEVKSQDYIAKKIWEDKNLEMLSDKTKSVLIKEGVHPKIHDFSISDEDGKDVTMEILQNPEYNFLLVMEDIDKAVKKSFPKINELVKGCDANKIKVIGLTASADNTVENFRHEVGAAFPFYKLDNTALKTMIRSNPGLILLKSGTVINMWDSNRIPTFEELQKRYFNN